MKPRRDGRRERGKERQEKVLRVQSDPRLKSERCEIKSNISTEKGVWEFRVRVL